MKERTRIYAVMLAVFALVSAVMVLGDPIGAGTTVGTGSRGNNTLTENATAWAGNVTPVNIDQTAITTVWQGFFGNVSGGIVLEDSAGNNFYDWTIASVSGEVYAVRSFVTDWSGVNCTNSTHWETEEAALSIDTAKVDGINETFNSTAHVSFEVASRTMVGCRSAAPYTSGGTYGNWWNVLLNTDDSTTVYTVLLNDSQTAYDGGIADFEILVPVDTSTSTSLYHFYAELD